jgi:hypothetical protein
MEEVLSFMERAETFSLYQTNTNFEVAFLSFDEGK